MYKIFLFFRAVRRHDTVTTVFYFLDEGRNIFLFYNQMIMSRRSSSLFRLRRGTDALIMTSARKEAACMLSLVFYSFVGGWIVMSILNKKAVAKKSELKASLLIGIPGYILGAILFGILGFFDSDNPLTLLSMTVVGTFVMLLIVAKFKGDKSANKSAGE